MLKRQDSLLSSSRRQTPPPPEKHRVKSVGCMSGIFQLISKYQNRHKLLTFGRKHEKKAVSTSQSSVEEENHKIVVLDNNFRKCDSNKRLSTEMVPRSPVLSQKIRRSNGGNSPPALVARLMGLEELPPAAKEVKNKLMVEQLDESTEEKRQRLLQALEKCNTDLEALKKIIVAVQSCDQKDLQSASLMVNDQNQMKNDEIGPTSPLNNYSKLHANGNLQQQGKKMMVKKPGEEDDIIGISFLSRVVLTESLRIKRKATTTPSFWSSKAMIQSVDEVCNDIAWGEKREMGNIGLTLQNQIFKDLIDEAVKELSYYCMYSLPFDACKRRLSFK